MNEKRAQENWMILSDWVLDSTYGAAGLFFVLGVLYWIFGAIIHSATNSAQMSNDVLSVLILLLVSISISLCINSLMMVWKQYIIGEDETLTVESRRAWVRCKGSARF